MKIRTALCASITCILTTLHLASAGQGGNGRGLGNIFGNGNGGSTNVTVFDETYRATFVLQPTEFGPENARGKVELRSSDDQNSGPVLEVKTLGLGPGHYTVQGIGPGSAFTAGHDVERTNGVAKSKSNLDDPGTVNPTGITRILLSTTDGITLMVADLDQPGKSTAVSSSSASLKAGEAGTNVNGVARWRQTWRNGIQSSRIQIFARDLPKSIPLSVVFNGEEVDEARSSPAGRLFYGITVQGQAGTNTLQFLNSQGAEVFSTSR